MGGGDPLRPDWRGAKLGKRVGIEAGFGQEGAEKLLTPIRGWQRIEPGQEFRFDLLHAPERARTG